MKCLSVRQPFASLILSGAKNIENRGWGTKYRGMLAVHASKKIVAADMRATRAFCKLHHIPFPSDFPTGGIIGTVELVGLLIPTPEPEPENQAAIAEQINLLWYEVGSVGWVLQNPKPCDLIPYPGRLQLFEIPDSILGS